MINGTRFESVNLKLIFTSSVKPSEKAETCLSGADFYVRSMVLDEGLGIIPTARLELASSAYNETITMETLDKLIGTVAAVQFSEVDDHGDACDPRRWMSGLITEVDHLGVIYLDAEGRRICGYRMTIQPSLVHLCHRRSRFQFANSSAEKAVTAILKSVPPGPNGITPTIPPVGFSAKGVKELWSTRTRDFSQGDESDYEFLVRTLASCGLSYCYKMDKQDEQKGASEPTLCIVDSSTNPASFRSTVSSGVTDSLEQAEGEISLYYKNIRADGCIGKMLAWEMSESIGTGACEVAFGDARGTNLSAKSAVDGIDKDNLLRLNHVPFDNARTKEDVENEVSAYLGAIRRRSRVWLGVTPRLEARVGMSIILKGFYGAKEPDIKDMLVVRTRTRIESKSKSSDCPFFVNEDWRQYVSVGCVKAASGDSRCALPTGAMGEDAVFGGTKASGDFAQVEQVVKSGGGAKILVNVEKDWRNAAGASDAWQPATMLVQATVCDPTGNTQSTNNTCALRVRKVWTTDDPPVEKEEACYEFHAIPDGVGGQESKDKVMVVRFVQPVGGLGQGLYRVPRIGDRVLVIRYSPSGMSLGGINYLMGYLPGADMKFTTETELKRTAADPKNKTALGHEMTALRFQTPGTVGDGALAQSVGLRRKGTGNACSELAFYNTHDAIKWDQDGGDQDDMTFDKGKVRDEVAEKLFKKKYADLTKDTSAEGKKKLAKVDAEVAVREKEFNERRVLANFQSSGNMQVSATHNLELNARNVHLCSAGRSGWKKNNDGKFEMGDTTGNLYINDFNKVIIDVKRSITLKVGRNFITVNQNGISIRSLKQNPAGGPLDSYIYMDAISGTSIGGLNCSMNGFMGVSVGDRLGGALTIGAGSASLSGAGVSLSTFGGLDYAFNTAVATEECFSQLAGFGGSEDLQKTKAGNVKITQGVFSTILEMYRVIRDCAIALNGNEAGRLSGARKGLKVFTTILKLINLIIDIIRLGMEAKNEAWMSQPAAGVGGNGKSELERDYVTNRDAFRYAILSTKFTIFISDTASTFIKFASSSCLGIIGTSNLSLTFGEKEGTAHEACCVTFLSSQYESPAVVAT